MEHSLRCQILVALLLSTCGGAAVAGQSGDDASGAAKPLTLHRAMLEALRNSPSLRRPEDGVAVAEIQQHLAGSQFGLKIAPSFSAGTEPFAGEQHSVGVAVGKRLTTGAEVNLTVNSLKYGPGHAAYRDAGYTVALSQPLLQGFGPSATVDLKNARRALDSSASALAEARQQLALTVAEAYFGVLRQQRLVASSDRALERAHHLKAASDARSKVGLATQLDVLRAELLASQSESNLTAQREALQSALDQLKLLLGRSLDVPLEIAPEDPIAISDLVARDLTGTGVVTDIGERSGAIELNQLVQHTLRSRPEVRESHERIADAQRAATVARWNLLPQVNLNASYTRRGLGSSDPKFLNRLYGGWRLGLTSAYTLDRTAGDAGVGLAEISLQAARRAALDTEQRIAAEVRRAHRAWIRSAEAIAIQQKALELAEQQLRLAQLRYERGLAGNFDVVDAEANVVQAQSALISAQIDRVLAALAMQRAIGVLDPLRLFR